MSPADLAALKSRIEAALAESAKEFGGGMVPAKGPARIVTPIDRAWALVNVDDTRAVLTDHAVKLLGGKDLVVTVNEDEIVIGSATAKAATPAAPSPAPPAAPAQ
jgi:hypothetical protein